jgi:hypothetical protein
VAEVMLGEADGANGGEALDFSATHQMPHVPKLHVKPHFTGREWPVSSLEFGQCRTDAHVHVHVRLHSPIPHELPQLAMSNEQ